MGTRPGMFGRAAAMLVIALAFLIQMMMGTAGPAWLCICSPALSAQHEIRSCCAQECAEEKDAEHGDTQLIIACHGCVEMPFLEAVTVVAVMSPPAWSSVVLENPPILLARILWSPPVSDRRHYEFPPPDQQLRSLRSVILIC